MADRFVAYYRVSTKRQGQSGLGLDAQRQAVLDFIAGKRVELVAEFTEVESGKRHDNRPELSRAMQMAKATGSRLLIAKLDRLSRNAAFLLSLRDSGVEFVAADMPEANTLTVGIMAVVAQDERERISARTKAALQAAKARGVKLGCPRGAEHLKGLGNVEAVQAVKEQAQNRAENIRAIVEEVLPRGATKACLAKELNRLGIQSPRGSEWTRAGVGRLLERLSLGGDF